MNFPFFINGNIWVFPQNDIDTDQILASQYLYIKTIKETATHTLEIIDPEFASKVKPNTILVTGKNFGCGSSREKAVDVFNELKVSAIVAKSFARIFFRNAINKALPVFECQDLNILDFHMGDKLELHLESGLINNINTKKEYHGTKFPDFLIDIIKEGGIINYYKK